ncbi:hypothetical protein QE152_g12733 [Popillia japonica]|uniref:DDE-1 domain-containing protein n=1 Tax=Popillia japonica TaxID=7064 RepID=A0AAW1LQ53_POPJA
MLGSEEKEYTSGAPSKALQLQWILNAWKQMPNAVVSFKACVIRTDRELSIKEDIEEADTNEVLIDNDIEYATVSTSEGEETISYDEDSSEEDL